MATPGMSRHYGGYSASSPAMGAGASGSSSGGAGSSSSSSTTMSSMRATSAANEAAAAAAAFLGMPARLSANTRMPWARLPVDTSATVRWQCWQQDEDVVSETPANQASGAAAEGQEGVPATAAANSSQQAWQSALRTLKQHSMEEAIRNAAPKHTQDKSAAQPDSSEKHDASLRHALLNANLWTFDSPSTDKSQLWFFDIDVPSSSGQTLLGATQNVRKEAKASLQKLDGAFKLREGSIKLSETYKAEDGTSAASLVPNANIRTPLRFFLHALEDFFIRRWVWTREQQVQMSIYDARPTESTVMQSQAMDEDLPPTRKVKDVADSGDDEEEGALGAMKDSTKDITTFQDDKLVDWTVDHGRWLNAKRNRRQRVRRLGRGVIIENHKPNRHADYMDIGTGADDEAALHCGLQCFCNDMGEIYMSTYARETYLRPCSSTDEDIDVILAPTRRRARLNGIRRIPGVAEGEQASHKSRDARVRLLATLQLDGAIIDSSTDDWALCTTSDGNDFLWPAALCLKGSAEPCAAAPQPSNHSFTRFTASESVSNEALGLVREAMGIKATEYETEDDEAMSEDEIAEESAREDSAKPKSEPLADGEDAKALAESAARLTADIKVEPLDGPQKAIDSQPAQDANASSIAATRRPSTTRPPSAGKPVGQPEVLSRRPSRSNDDDLDLWGSFGFGDAEDVTMRAQLPSRDGLEDSGFGLVTEDDFSFFDDAAAAFADFDAPSMPMITEEPDDTVMQQGDIKDAASGQLADQDFTMSRQASQDDTDSNRDSGHSTAQTMTDPPSLPAFTPGSFSTNSPTAGGLSNKTPRTPYSPNQDLADANIRIEGEDGLHYSDHEQGNVGNGVVARDLIGHPHAGHDDEAGSPDQESAKDTNGSDAHARHMWMLGQRRGIKSKYQDGKYAMPDAGPTEQGNSPRDDDDQQQKGRRQKDRISARHRLANRSVDRYRVQNIANYHKARLSATRIDDAISEVTEDDAMSDWSSLHDKDSDDESETSDDAEAGGENDQEKWLSSLFETASTVLASVSTNSPIQALEGEKQPSQSESTTEESRALDDEKIQGVLKHMVDCQYMRRQARKARHANAAAFVSGTDIQHLFVPFTGMEVDRLSLKDSLQSSKGNKNEEGRGHAYLMDPPRLVTGSQDSVVSLTPIAMTYWHKLKLQAVHGPKHLVAFGLYTGKLAVTKQAVFREWFTSLESQFVESALGTHTLAQDGLLNLGGPKQRSISQVIDHMVKDDEQWSDTLASLLSRFSQDLLAHKGIVLYAICQEGDTVVPQGWAVSKLERDLRQLALQKLGTPPQLIAIRYVSFDVIYSPRMTQNDPACDISRFAMSVYDSMPTALLPSYNAEAYLPAYKTDSFSAFTPSFSVLPSVPRHLGEPQLFDLDWKAESLNILAQGNSLHFAYHIAAAPKQVTVLTMMDEQGNEHAVIGWRRVAQTTLEDELRRIWTAMTRQTRRVRMLWRVVICKNCPMGEVEAGTWDALLRQWSAGKDAQSFDHVLDVTLACADTNAPMSLVVEQSADRGSSSNSSATSMPQSNSATDNKTTALASKAPPEKLLIDPLRAQYLLMPAARVGMPVAYADESEALLPLRSACVVTIPQMWSGAAPKRHESLMHDSSMGDPNQVLQSNSTTSSHSLWVHILQVHVRKAGQGDEEKSEVANTTTGAKAPTLETRLLRIMHQFQALELIARERAIMHLDDVSRHLPWHLAILAALEASVVPTMEAM